MARARRVSYKILYDGKEIGLSGNVNGGKLESLSYTDNDQGRSDEITLTLEDRSAAWIRNETIIEKEHDLDVTLEFHDWERPGDYASYHCGNFTVDDINFSGRPLVCVIKGVSIPAGTEFQTVKKSKTWQNVTVKQIAAEKMQIYGMKNLFFNANEDVIEKVEQSDQSDSEFMYDLCEKQGLFLKVYKTGFVIFDKKWYDDGGPKYTFSEKDFEDWGWNSTLNQTYTGATISYTDPNHKGHGGRKPEKAQYISVTIGEGPRILYINEHVKDEAEARRKAAAKLNKENEKAVTMNFTLFGAPYLYATNNFAIEGMGRMNGKYYTESVTHTFSGSGHKATAKGYRVFKRF